MDIYIEQPRLFVDKPRQSVDQPRQSAWLTSSAAEYLLAVLRDLKHIDEEFQCEDSRRLVQRTCHIVRAATGRQVIEYQHLKREAEAAFGKLPVEVKNQSKTPIETTLELLVRALIYSCAEEDKPKSLYQYRSLLNEKLSNTIKTQQLLENKQSRESCGMPTMLFVCIGPHNGKPVHVVTTTREKYCIDNQSNTLDKWAKDTFRDRLGMNDDTEFQLVQKCSISFYEHVMNDEREPYNAPKYNAPTAEQTLAGNIIKYQVTVAEKVRMISQGNHRANSAAVWMTKSSIMIHPGDDLFTAFDHSSEMAVAFDLKSKSNSFDFRARCFRCRAVFCYKQIPHATYAEGNFPYYWNEGQNYGVFCAEIPGHFLCRAASRTNAATFVQEDDTQKAV